MGCSPPGMDVAAKRAEMQSLARAYQGLTGGSAVSNVVVVVGGRAGCVLCVCVGGGASIVCVHG